MPGIGLGISKVIKASVLKLIDNITDAMIFEDDADFYMVEEDNVENYLQLTE